MIDVTATPETVLKKNNASARPDMNDLYAAIETTAPHRAALDEARRQEQEARERYAASLEALQAQCPHPVIVEMGLSGFDPIEDPSSNTRVCLCCNARECVYTYQHSAPIYGRIKDPLVRIYASKEETFRALETAAPIPPMHLPRILRAKNDRELDDCVERIAKETKT